MRKNAEYVKNKLLFIYVALAKVHVAGGADFVS